MIHHVTEQIQNRRSVRTFDGRSLAEEDVKGLMDFAKTVENPYRIPVAFKMMQAKEYGLNCPITVGTDLFIDTTKMKNIKF